MSSEINTCLFALNPFRLHVDKKKQNPFFIPVPSLTVEMNSLPHYTASSIPRQNNYPRITQLSTIYGKFGTYAIKQDNEKHTVNLINDLLLLLRSPRYSGGPERQIYLEVAKIMVWGKSFSQTEKR